MNIFINTILAFFALCLFALAVLELDYFLMLYKEKKPKKKMEYKIRKKD